MNASVETQSVIFELVCDGTEEASRDGLLVEARFTNRTQQALSLRLVHWGGNGIAPAAPASDPDAPDHAWFFSIYGGELPALAPGMTGSCGFRFVPVNDARFARSQPRSSFAMLIDAATDEVLARVTLPLPGYEAA